MLYVLVAAILVVLDQVSKYWVRTHMAVGESLPFISKLCQLTYVQNRGAAFSSMQGMRWLLVALTVVFVIAAFWALCKGKIRGPLGRWSLVVVLGGAVGNLIDRVLFGYVVDMFDVLFMNFAVFNVADIFVVCGGIVLCVYLAFFSDLFDGKQKNAPQSEEDDTGKGPES